MNAIKVFIENYLNFYLLFIIVLGGIYIIKYTQPYKRMKDVYKILISSFIFSGISYVLEDCSEDCLPEYVFTYLFATSFYELIVKLLIEKVQKYLNSKKTNIVILGNTGSHPDPDKEEK